MKKDYLREIKWAAHSYSAWRRIARQSPIFRVYQIQTAKAHAELQSLCAMYRVLFCCNQCNDINRGKL